MTRTALIVGINYYQHDDNLFGCVQDANKVKEVLYRNDDHEDRESNTNNFECQLLTASSEYDSIGRTELRNAIEALFQEDHGIALFYFAGHGHIDSTGGYLMASDSRLAHEGVSLSDILTLANNSPAKNKVIILDSCHSGIAGNPPTTQNLALLSEGLTILAASTKEQYATEEDNQGIFTDLLVDALNGAAANLIGEISPGSVYAHIDQSLGNFKQRPVFKTNIKRFICLRRVKPDIQLGDLRKIATYFPEPGYEYKLDPTYEPELAGRPPGAPPPIKAHTDIFAILQQYNRLNLLKPVGVRHMWNAAMESKSCKLTPLGEHYRRLVIKNRLGYNS